MNGRTSGGEPTGGTEHDEGPVRWAWIAGVASPVVTFLGLTGAVLMTPGDPLSCSIPNPGAWMLCEWLRRFVSNAITVAIGLTIGNLAVALLIGIPRAVLREVRN